MKPFLSKAARQLREQVDDSFPDRDRHSDGWIGDAKHAATKSDHNPDSTTGCVRAIDIDSNLSKHGSQASYLADQIRLFGKSDARKRIAYVIYNKRIASPILGWRWRAYKGINPHTSHIHVSFTKAGDADGSFLNIPLLGGK